jgi:hypothetical protein
MIDTANEETVTDEKLKLTRAEAVAWIRAAKPGTKFNAHVSMTQAVLGDDELAAATRTTIPLTGETALELVHGYLSDYAESLGRRIPCGVYTARREGRPAYVAYWIG